jgi:hypothetical protein
MQAWEKEGQGELGRFGFELMVIQEIAPNEWQKIVDQFNRAAEANGCGSQHAGKAVRGQRSPAHLRTPDGWLGKSQRDCRSIECAVGPDRERRAVDTRSSASDPQSGIGNDLPAEYLAVSAAKVRGQVETKRVTGSEEADLSQR